MNFNKNDDDNTKPKEEYKDVVFINTPLLEFTRLATELKERYFFEGYKIFPADQLEKVPEEYWKTNLNAVKLILECWIVDNPQNVSSVFRNSLDETRSEKAINFELCEEYRKCGTQGYINFIEQLRVYYGDEFLFSKFGNLIRNRVPDYYFNKIDSIDISKTDGIQKVLTTYPKGFSSHIGITSKQILEGLVTLNRANLNRIALEISDDFNSVIPFLCSRGIIKDKTDFIEVGFYYGYDEVERCATNYYMKNKENFPDWLIETISPENLEKYKAEIAADASAKNDSITTEEIAPEEAAKSALIGTSTALINEAKAVEETELNPENNIKEGETKDD